MTRISLTEAYDNRSVIEQIRALTESSDSASDTADTAQATADSALANVTAIATTAQSAVDTADIASDKADTAQATADTAQATADTAQATADTAQAGVNDNLADVQITTGYATGTLRTIKRDGTASDTALTIASASETGLMNAQTFAGVANLEDRVSVLEGKSTSEYVSFPSNAPTQSEITAVFTTASGRVPIAGDYATDIAQAITYGYDGTEWVDVSQDDTIPQFTATTFGLIKGGNTATDGVLIAEADGTGSVQGWDELVIDVGTKQAQLISTIVSIPVASWNENTATVIVNGVTAESIIWVAPASDSALAYSDAGVRADTQSAGILTFVCTKTPTETIYVNLVIA